jgi:hypothetical protein
MGNELKENMLKNISQLTTKINEKEYITSCDHDASVEALIEHLLQCLTFSRQILENVKKSQEEKQKTEEKPAETEEKNNG